MWSTHWILPTRASLGVNMNELLVSQPDSGEEALTIAETLIKSNAVDVVVLDSVAALITKAELEGQMGDATVGAQARLMSQAMRKLTSFISKSKTCAIFTNQIREKIGVMFGNPETTPARAGVEVLLLSARGYPSHRGHQDSRWHGAGQSHQGENREEQGGAAVSRGGVRHHV